VVNVIKILFASRLSMQAFKFSPKDGYQTAAWNYPYDRQKEEEYCI